VVLQPGLSIMLPDGLTLADGHEVDGAALAAFMAEPPAGFGTGVRTSSVQVFWGLGLWLATRDSRSCGVTEELAAGDASTGRRWAASGWRPRPGSWTPAASPCSPRTRWSRRPGRGGGSWPWR